MNKNYSEILKKIQNVSAYYQNEENTNFFDNVVDNIVLEELGYKTCDLSYNREMCTVHVNSLAIRSSTKSELNRELSMFEQYLKFKAGEKMEWGIFIYPAGMCLINVDINLGAQKKILEIIYGLNTDQKYFKYFFRENIVGKARNAYFYKDIISYKNTKYKGTEKSWYAYWSTLKRFFNYYVEKKGNYDCYGKNVYDNINFSFFQDFIRKGTKAKSLRTVKNEFFHIKEMMCDKSSNGQFDRSTDDLAKSFPEFKVKNDFYDIEHIDDFMDRSKIKKMLNFRTNGRNVLRNKAILLFLFAYGLERRKLCSLEWNKNVFTKKSLLQIEGKEYPMPTYLKEVLEELKKTSSGQGLVFGNNGKAFNEGTFNTIVSGFGEVETEDEFYKQLSPANIRKGLAKYLLWHGYPLQKIFYLMDIDGNKLASYITKDEIVKAVWEDREKLDCPMNQHPLEGFFEALR